MRDCGFRLSVAKQQEKDRNNKALTLGRERETLGVVWIGSEIEPGRKGSQSKREGLYTGVVSDDAWVVFRWKSSSKQPPFPKNSLGSQKWSRFPREFHMRVFFGRREACFHRKTMQKKKRRKNNESVGACLRLLRAPFNNDKCTCDAPKKVSHALGAFNHLSFVRICANRWSWTRSSWR